MTKQSGLVAIAICKFSYFKTRQDKTNRRSISPPQKVSLFLRTIHLVYIRKQATENKKQKVAGWVLRKARLVL